jgi:2-isopropylmalate synthase
MTSRADVEIHDTTLRDGTQREGVSFSVDDKLRIARRLDDLGVAFVEAGWPGSNPKDAELFRRAAELPWRRAALAAFGSTRRAGTRAADDAGLAALVAARTPVCTLFGKSWLLHVADVLRTTPDENLRMIEDSVAHLRAAGRRVIYDAEHFFDGYDADAAYALDTLRAALRAGAETVVLCDTNGGSLPWRVEEIVRAVRGALPDAALGIHTHNDGDCAVANALAAIRAGARHAQGTINGWGERCGNANLCSLIPDLELKLGLRALPDGGLAALTELSRFVADVANLPVDDGLPYVGRSAFAHKGGVHVAALRRAPGSYQHIDPALVGNRARVVVSELAGRANLATKAEELGIAAVDDDAPARVALLIKDNEARGLSYESAEASVALLLRRQAPAYRAPFTLLSYEVIEDARGARATVHVALGGRAARAHAVRAHAALALPDATVRGPAPAAAIGPVAALDSALRRAIAPFFPALERIALVDYKVRILDGRLGARAITRVQVESSDGARRWSTVGAAPSILAASWQALADGIEYGLTTRPEDPP